MSKWIKDKEESLQEADSRKENRRKWRGGENKSIMQGIAELQGKQNLSTPGASHSTKRDESKKSHGEAGYHQPA